MAEAKEINVVYKKALFHRRVLANLLDILICGLLFVCFFLATRAIVCNSSKYKAIDNSVNQVKKDSGLYVEMNGMLVNVITYMNNNENYSTKMKEDGAVSAIDTFIKYIGDTTGKTNQEELIKDYKDYRLRDSLTFNGVKYFVLDNDVVIKNPECKASYGDYYTNVYTLYIDYNCASAMFKYIPNYYENTKFISTYVLFIEIPIAYSLSGLLAFVLPVFIFKRDHKTFSKALYSIGLVDKNLLRVSTKRMIYRELIFYFGIYILSLVTLGIPVIVSFSLMAFSKKKQGFADYMLDLTEIDISQNKIFYDKNEVLLENANVQNKGIEFRNRINFK